MRVAQSDRFRPGVADGLIGVVALVLALSGCGPSDDADQTASVTAETQKARAIASGKGAHKLLDSEEAETALLHSLQRTPSWTGGFDGMVK